jgi:predicted transposase YbfD/YdcC
LRRAYQEGGAKAPIHMISAWSARQRLVLGQTKVADKSNEITAIPDLLDLLTLKGATVTIDAMGCQKEIARKIKEKEADYVLALKGNQGTLRQDVELFFSEQQERKFADTTISRHQTLEKSHGRIETRTYTSIDDIDWLKQRHHWAGLRSIVMVESVREIVGGRTESETPYLLINRLMFRGDLLAVASAATKKFYSQADELFRDPNLPEDLKALLYDMLLAVTKDDVGKLVCQALVKVDDRPRARRDGGLEASLKTLIREHPGVAAKFLDVVRLAVTSIVYSHAYPMRRAAIAVAKTAANDQSGLVRAVEALERKLGEAMPASEPVSAVA